MPKIRARTSWADRKTGDEFDVNEVEAKILCAPDLPGGQKAEYVDRAMTPIEPQKTQGESPPTPATPEKRRYQRRDLQADK